MRNWQLKAILPALKHVIPSMPGIGNDIKKPGADEVGYTRTPLRALHTLVRAWPIIEADLGKVTAPLLMFRSMDDHVVDDTSIGLIQHGVSSSVAEYITLTDSYHVATLDFDAQLIFDRSADFLTQHLGSPR
jgi:carboxylesterase